MNQEEYYKRTLAALRAELDHEKVFVDNLKKNIDKMEQEGFTPLDSFKEVLAEREAKRDSVARAIENLEASVRK
jgi:bacterioferritin (cytochrome b1)